MKKKIMRLLGTAMFCLIMVANAVASDDGTVTDGNLVWLKNANCFETQVWPTARDLAANLKSGSCGLRDGSTAGQWRLPTQQELQSRQKNLQGFYGVRLNLNYYWSSSSFPGSMLDVWVVNMHDGHVLGLYKGTAAYVWPVRAVK